MPSQTNQPAQMPAKSPLLAAVGISLAIGLGALLGTADPATIEDAVTGKWLTRPFTETQQSHMVAIAALEHGLGGVSRDVDFVAERVDASIQRSQIETSSRLAKLDAEVAALKDVIAGMQNARFAAPRVPAPSAPGPTGEEVTGLRSSLHDLANAHRGAVAALTKRLDRIEVMVGLSTDTTSSVANPLAQRAARRHAAARPQGATLAKQTATRAPTGAQFERGHIFNLKPVSQRTAPLRGNLPG